MSFKCAKIISVGTAVPPTVLTNKDLEKFLDTSDEWITSRTGIHERHVFEQGKAGKAHELGSQAAAAALRRADLKAADIDGIICATFTPDYFFPSTACLIGNDLGCGHIVAFDLSAACSGFVYGLAIANAMILTGQCRRILLVGAEVISKTLDWTDRTTCILFGDGAGAVVIEGRQADSDGILATSLSSDGSLGDILSLPAWGENRRMFMKGQEVFKHAVRMMNESTRACLDMCGLATADIDLVIPHQANIRILKSLAEKLAMPFERVVINLDRFGNTSSASIPLALDEAWSAGRVKSGTKVLFTSLGGGVTVASAVVRF
jgi:3-oxoacyl-[acyl-carrier-protein] synthase III